jgi:hypothetical protein
MVPRTEGIFVMQELDTERIARSKRLRFETRHFSIVKSQAV